jgi:hypothetical protein
LILPQGGKTLAQPIKSECLIATSVQAQALAMSFHIFQGLCSSLFLLHSSVEALPWLGHSISQKDVQIWK